MNDINEKEVAATPTSGVPLKRLVMPLECADLIRFLCAVWSDVDTLRYKAYAMDAEEMKEFLINKWPVIQGTKNQIDLLNIGR